MIKAHRIEEYAENCYVITIWELRRLEGEEGWQFKDIIPEDFETLEEAAEYGNGEAGFRLPTGVFSVEEHFLPFTIGFEEC